jgi:hypothetical protein
MPITISGSTGIAGVDGSASTPAVQGTDTNTGIYFGADAIYFTEGGVQCAAFDSSANFQFNSGYGSVATAYGCRAWVYFNGTGTVAINSSGNVSSITDNGTGTYTVNFTTAMPDANYSVTGTCSNNDNNRNESGTLSYGSSGTYSTTAVQVWTVENTGSSTADTDMPRISVAIFR